MAGRRSRPPESKSAPVLADQPGKRLEIVALALLVTATLVVYWPVTGFEFVNYDDNEFIFDNPRMQQGLTLRNIPWAFTVRVVSNWHPLTTLTHLLDCSIYHLNAGGHHFTSLLLHLANVALLYLLLRRLSLSAGAALLTAALFAIHPINVESVAWVAERKNVLSQLFLLLTLLAYAGYARTRTCRSYVVTLLMFAAGLMSKAMLVSVPALLLLLDFWPLRRGSVAPARAALRDLLRLLPEKVPFMLLSLGASVLTLVTQRETESVGGLDIFPVAARLMNAVVSYVAYIGAMFCPVHLSVIYPHPGVHTGTWRSIGAASLLLGASVVAWRQRIRRPYIVVGWLWYLIALIPVIGLVQVGSQARADRYAYMPLIGLFMILAMLAEEVAGRLPVRGRAMYAWAAGSLLVLSVSIATRSQVLVWQNTPTLFEHALGHEKGAYAAHHNMGLFYARNHRYNEAQKEFEAALAVKPDFHEAWNNLGQVKLEQNDLEGAVRSYKKAIEYDKSDPKMLNNLGTALARLGRYAESAGYFEEALRLDPAYISPRYNHAMALSELGRTDEAIVEYRKLIEIKPEHSQAHSNLGLIYYKQGKLEEALASFEAALRLEPDNPQAKSGAEEVRRRLGVPKLSP